jgi:hypothetical protein
MNWRGIFGIYAGFAVVLGGGWLWMRTGAVWTFAIIGLGIAIAIASVVQIVLARRGPRPAKEAKPGKTSKAKAALAADADEMDAAVRVRMAAIAGRSSGRSVAEAPLAEAEMPVADEAFESDSVQSETVDLANDIDEADVLSEPDEHEIVAEVPEPETEIAVDAEDDPEPVDFDVSEIHDAPTGAVLEAWHDASPHEVVDGNAGDPDPVPSDALVTEGGEGDAEEQEVEHVAAIDPEEPAVATAYPKPDVVTEAVLSLDRQPGFPWTARYIALWAQEVRENCPDDFRDAVAHWQRWAVQQSAAAPLVEEAAEEFRAMIDVWRADLGNVPELAASDWPMRQLYREADDDEGLAALLPVLTREVVA